MNQLDRFERPQLYLLQHRVLPESAFENHPELMKELTEGIGEDPLLHMRSLTKVALSRLAEVTPDFSAKLQREFEQERNDFQNVSINRYKKMGHTAYIITMPQPRSILECSFVAIVHKDSEPHKYDGSIPPSTRYFTLEYSVPNPPQFCEWESNLSRKNYGAVSSSNRDHFSEMVFNEICRQHPGDETPSTTDKNPTTVDSQGSNSLREATPESSRSHSESRKRNYEVKVTTKMGSSRVIKVEGYSEDEAIQKAKRKVPLWKDLKVVNVSDLSKIQVTAPQTIYNQDNIHQLETWHFVSPGNAPNPSPICTEIEGKHALIGFNAFEDAQRFAASQESKQHTIISIPSNSTEFFDSILSQGIVGILFDSNSRPFFYSFSEKSEERDAKPSSKLEPSAFRRRCSHCYSDMLIRSIRERRINHIIPFGKTAIFQCARCNSEISLMSIPNLCIMTATALASSIATIGLSSEKIPIFLIPLTCTICITALIGFNIYTRIQNPPA